MTDLRIVLLGKTGEGKSSCGNTILGEKVFATGNSPNSLTNKCETSTKSISGRELTVVDVPGFFDTSVPQEELNVEVLKCITECAPGPHAFVVVLKVGKYTEHEKETVREITRSFGEEALRYTLVLFTYGDQLSEGQTIEDFVRQNAELQEFVDKCGGRVHVIDNKYWNQQQEGYRSNKVQVEKLLNTIDMMMWENGGEYYTNEMLQMVNREIEEEYQHIINKSNSKKENKQLQEMKKQAKHRVQTRLCVRLVGVGTGVLVGALLGCASAVAIMLDIINRVLPSAAAITTASAAASAAASTAVSAAGAAAGATAGAAAGAATGPMVAGTVFGVATVAGAVVGGILGYEAVEGAETMTDAMKLAAKAPFETAIDIVESITKKTHKTQSHHH